MKKKKRKLKKDPDAPKRPLTAYMIWLNVGGGRAAMKAEHADANVMDIAKMCGVQWKGMNATEKKKYTDQAKKAKKVYDLKKKAYDKKRAKNAKPKRPATAFFVFSAARRPGVKEENPGMKVTEIAKLLGTEWRALKENEKHLKYEEKAAELKAAYNMVLEKWTKKHETPTTAN